MSNMPNKAATKTEVHATLAEKTGLTKKQVAHVMDSLQDYIKSQIGKKGPGIFVLPGVMKIKRVRKPKRRARMGRNPMTGEAMQIAAKPARIVIKVVPLKSLRMAADLEGDIGIDP